MTTSAGIPFLDLVTPHLELEHELTRIFHQVLSTAGFIGGPMVEEFEKAFAAFCTTKHSVAVNSGTALMNVTPWPMKTLSSIVTPSQTKVWLEILHRLPTIAFF
jgi:dTDP-4-amino-4,6-dideoxygalactose transaminase